PTHPLSPVIPNNVSKVRLTAAAGTNLALASSADRSTRYDYVPRFPPHRQRFTTRKPSSRTRHRSVRLASIAEDPRLQPPVGVWAVSQSQCGRTPAKAGYPSMLWWAVTLTNKLIGHRSLPEWRHIQRLPLFTNTMRLGEPIRY